MDNFVDEDIDLFCSNYKEHIASNPLLNSKIPIWVEYLKTKKHYKENGMDEDYFFKRRFAITDDDLITIHKLIDRVKRGKTLTKISTSNIKGASSTLGSNIYGMFDETKNYEDTNSGFELMNEIAPALNDYNKKMKKHQNRHKWKESNDSRVWDPIGTIKDEPDRYYTEELYSTRPQVEFDVQDFGRTQMFNMNKTNIIQQLDEINDILDSNNLITNDFDTEYKRSVPVINSKKKVQFTNKIDPCIGNNELTESNRSEYKFGNGMVSGLEQGLGGPVKYTGGPEASRLWQDVDLLSGRGLTRKPSVENRTSYEHQFQYLDGNYNRVPDPRITGTSSRLENRSNFKR
jgi:hypothetical protein